MPMGLLPDTWNSRLCIPRECRERFPRQRLQRKPVVSNPGMHHDTCVTHVTWCMSRSLICGGGQNVPGIPGVCATRNFTYLARGPLFGPLSRFALNLVKLLPLILKSGIRRFHLRISYHRINCSDWTKWLCSSLVFTGIYPTLAREFQGFRAWGKFVFRTLELTDTPTNLANQVKAGHALGQSRSVQSRGPGRAQQNNEPSWRSSRTDRRLSRQFWDD